MHGRRIRVALLVLALGVGLAGPGSGGAADERLSPDERERPTRDGGRGPLTLTLRGPTSGEPGAHLMFGGRLTAGRVGVPAQEVDIVIGVRPGGASRITRTDAQGYYRAMVVIPTEGMFQLQAVVYRTTRAETRSEPLTVRIAARDPSRPRPPPPDDPAPDGLLRILGYRTDRVPGEVTVHVIVGGASGRLARLRGAVTIAAPNPCWPDGIPCPDVIDEQAHEFAAVASRTGRWRQVAGPFTYHAATAPPAAETCWQVHVVARVRDDRGNAAQVEDRPRLCA